MYLILLILHDPDLLEEVVKAWQEQGVSGATILFSTGMGRISQMTGVRDDIPLLPSLDDFYEAPQTLSRTIFTIVREESMIEKIHAATQRVVGDLNKPDTGLLVVLPVLKAYGLISKRKVRQR
jgi:hypothetical protein